MVFRFLPGLSRLWMGTSFVNLVGIGLPSVVKVTNLELKDVRSGDVRFHEDPEFF